MTATGTDLDPNDWNPHDPAFRHDPTAWYRALRDHAPVHYHPEVGFLISRHADVDALLRDERFGVATPSPWREVLAQALPGSMRMLSENMLLFVDPPQHARIRGLVGQAFTPRRVEALRPRLTEMVDTMLDELAASSGFDVVHDVAGPLPIMAITELLDLPTTEAPKLREWTLAMTAPDEIPMNFEVVPAAGRAADEFLAYADALIEHRRAHPGDDLISAFIAAEEGGEQLTHDELLGLIVLLLVAGHETTMSLVSTALLLLLQRPELATEVRDDEAVAPAVVEETLRFMGPLQVASGGGRWPFEPVELHGQTMEPGNRVRLLLGAANRDERVFADPDTFDLHRNTSRHVAFGKGLHFCVGAALGRLEGQVVIPAVLRRFPDLRLLDDEPNWRPGFVTRQLATLPVAVTG
ncbi:MAG: cytochrome P450 [Acidimicrobiia bacterium]